MKAETGTPNIVVPRDSGTFKFDVRLKNFGVQKVSARIEGQIVEHGRPDARQGGLITSEYKDMAPGEEAVYSLTFPTWSQSSDQLTWVRVGDDREELVDYRGSSRHVTQIQVSGEGAPTGKKIDLGSLFGAALKSMTQNRQVINRMDGYNGNHGDNMVQNLQLITEALRSRQSQSPSEALRYASQMLRSNGVGGSSRYYAQGLDDAAEALSDRPEMDGADVANLVLSILNAVPNQSDPSRSQVSDNVLAQIMGLTSQQPVSPPKRDMSATASQLLNVAVPAALAFMQAKQAGADTKSAAVQSLMSSLVGGQVNPLQTGTPRAAAGSLIAQSILQAMLG
ncbi:MAG: DAK2 domain-containing protein [Candidatus Bathyarchaeia archaeon]